MSSSVDTAILSGLPVNGSGSANGCPEAGSTKRTRSSQMRMFFWFVDEIGLTQFLPSPEETKLYVVWLMSVSYTHLTLPTKA